jgi:hypothetical protein
MPLPRLFPLRFSKNSGHLGESGGNNHLPLPTTGVTCDLSAHEIGHAATEYSPPLPGNTKDEFVEKNVRKDLEHEGSAAFENARARDEILNAKPPGPDIGIRGGSDSDYIDTYDAYKSGAITEEQAKAQMATTYSQEPQDRDASTGRYRTKEEQLADQYGKDWDKAHPQ